MTKQSFLNENLSETYNSLVFIFMYFWLKFSFLLISFMFSNVSISRRSLKISSPIICLKSFYLKFVKLLLRRPLFIFFFYKINQITRINWTIEKNLSLTCLSLLSPTSTSKKEFNTQILASCGHKYYCLERDQLTNNTYYVANYWIELSVIILEIEQNI